MLHKYDEIKSSLDTELNKLYQTYQTHQSYE